MGNAAEQRLLAIWRDVLGRQDIGIHDNFFDRGGDSVSGMQIVAQAHRDGMALTPAQIFEHQTVAGQAAAATAITLPNADATTAATGAAPLSPMQWAFLGRGSGRPQHHNQSLLLDVDPALDAERLRAALQTLVDRHDALRLRFEAVDDGGGGREWRQWHADRDAVSVPLQRIDLSTAADPLAALRTAIAAAQAGLDLTDGPLFHAVLFDLGTSRGARLLLVAHHLVVDGVSWRVLLLDLVRDVDTLRGGSAVAWAEGTGFGTWTTHLAAERPRFEAEVDHWLRACRPSVPLPLRVVDAARMVEGDVVEAAVALDAEATADLLGPVPPRLAAGIDDILLTALAQTLCQWTRGDAVTVDVESHGRQGFDARLDVSRTVGWFTAQYPLRLEVPRDAVERQLDAVKACRGAVPNAGIGYGVLRMAGRVPASPATVSFNYLGRIELPATGFIRGLAAEPVPAQRDPAAARGHALEVVAFVRDGQLQMLWRHHPAVLEPTTIAMLARRCVANLRSLIAVGGPSRARAPTRPTAAPAEPTDPRLRQLMARLKSGDS
ncbi:MAG: hypothetical protein KIT73_00180 [Burkholderiales bacterium]|nr:hypothetical protein [Burkholderiales bacterium]